MNEQNLLEMRGIRLTFGDKTVLDGVDLQVRLKDILVIMGVSGGGKSTLLNIILLLLEPTTGQVSFKGRELTQLPRRELNEQRTHIGMVFQNSALISSMSVQDNLTLPLQELTNTKPEEMDHAVDEKLSLVGLKDVKTKLPDELSGGMKKRVGLARALMLDPELVLFDEPSAGLDPIATEKIDDLILRLRDEHGVTSIVVTHELESAFAIATRIAFLDKGKIIFEGSPDAFKKCDHPLIQQFLAPWLAHEKKESHEHSSK
jgi:phospholipid/cholesterol/gamma-HCH transport system ATP-binding protein